MDNPTTTRDKSDELNKRIEDLEKEFAPAPFFKGRRVYYFASLLIFPLIVFALLFCFRPSFVLTRKKEGVVRDRKKLVRWTLVFTLVAYGAAYFYACYNLTPPVSFSPEILKT